MIKILLFGSLILSAHDEMGEPNWIAKGPYMSPWGGHCCGVSDCKKIADSEVKMTPKGYETGQSKFPYKGPGVYPSEDNSYWVCTPGCFFFPRGGV